MYNTDDAAHSYTSCVCARVCVCVCVPVSARVRVRACACAYLELCSRTLPLLQKEAVRTRIRGSLVKNQLTCLRQEAFTSEKRQFGQESTKLPPTRGIYIRKRGSLGRSGLSS